MSEDSAGVPGDGNSNCPSISGDGQIVAFASVASNLVTGDTNGLQDVFVHDRQSGITERVNVDSAGIQANAVTSCAAVSSDGRVVAFGSSAGNLVVDDTNSAADVFAHDRQTGLTSRVSVNSGGDQGSGDTLLTGGIAVSADGRYVAFDSFDNQLVAADTAAQDVFVRDRVAGATTRVSVDSQGNQGSPSSGYSFGPPISGDGRYVVFSAFSAFAADDTNNTTDVYLHDRQTGQTRRVSLSDSGQQANGDSRYPSISANGRFAAFTSEASNLVAGDTNTCPSNNPSCRDVFVRDLTAPVPATPTPGTPHEFATVLPRTGGVPADDGWITLHWLVLSSGSLIASATVLALVRRRMPSDR